MRECAGFCQEVFVLDFDTAKGFELVPNLIAKFFDSSGDALVNVPVPTQSLDIKVDGCSRRGWQGFHSLYEASHLGLEPVDFGIDPRKVLP